MILRLNARRVAKGAMGVGVSIYILATTVDIGDVAAALWLVGRVLVAWFGISLLAAAAWSLLRWNPDRSAGDRQPTQGRPRP